MEEMHGVVHIKKMEPFEAREVLEIEQYLNAEVASELHQRFKVSLRVWLTPPPELIQRLGREKRTLGEYLSLPYRMVIYQDKDYWEATFPELPGLVAVAHTWDELLAATMDAKSAWFESALEHGDPIPEPVG